MRKTAVVKVQELNSRAKFSRQTEKSAPEAFSFSGAVGELEKYAARLYISTEKFFTAR